MSSKNFRRDIYDLCYERPNVPVPTKREGRRRIECAESSEAKTNTRRNHLNEISKTLRNRLEKKDALALCLYFLTCSLDPISEKAPKVDHVAGLLPHSRPDTDCEEELINARLEATQHDFIDKSMAASLGTIGRLVVANQSDWTSEDEEPRLVYRLTHAGSHTFFDKDIGFCGGRWLREQNSEEPSKKDFTDHMGGERFESPYISLSDRPYRILQFAKWLSWKEQDVAEVCIMDFRILRAAKINTKRTTALAEDYSVRQERFVTKSHWLAWPCVPSCCIVMRVSFCDFQEVCNQNRIVRDDKYGSSPEETLDLEAFEKIRRPLGTEKEGERVQNPIGRWSVGPIPISLAKDDSEEETKGKNVVDQNQSTWVSQMVNDIAAGTQAMSLKDE